MPPSAWSSLGLAGALVACNGSEPDLPPPHDVQASWQVRCEAPNEACTYPARTLSGSIGPDDPDGFHAGCLIDDGALDASVGKSTFISSTSTIIGYGVSLDVGYDPATGFDLSRCAVLFSEDNDRLWGGLCSAAPPSPGFPCQLDAPILVDGTFAARLHCEDAPSIPFQANRAANLTSGTDATAPIALQISACAIYQP